MKSLLAALTLAFLAGCSHVAPAATAAACLPTTCGPHALRAPVSLDRPATHGMLVVGERTIYLSHLPMFHAPHDYQVIVEATFGGDVARAYAADRAKTGTKIYTLVPEPFVLPDVIQHRLPFSATLYRGHFERGGVAIADHVSVNLARVLLFRKFDPRAVKPTDAQYLLFGHGAETFLAHLIVAPPDYDQVVQVKPDAAMPDSVQGAGQTVTVAGHANGQALKEGEAVTAGAFGLGVTTELYHETGDLAD